MSTATTALRVHGTSSQGPCTHQPCKDHAVHQPHSSDDSTATLRLDITRLKACSSPISECRASLSPASTQSLPSCLPATAPLARACRTTRQPAPAFVPAPPPPASKSAMQTRQGSTQAALQNSTKLEPLSPPEPSEGPQAAADYKLYLKRWVQGTTVAQRWARLHLSGKAADIQEEWEDMQLDMMLQQHCGNTPQAAAARAAAAAASSQQQSGRGTRRSRFELEVSVEQHSSLVAADTENSASPGTRRVRSRQAPRAFRDFHLELPLGGKSADSSSPEPTATDSPAAYNPDQCSDMDAYIGAGILLDLFQAQSSGTTQQQQQVPAKSRGSSRQKQEPQTKPRPQQQQQQQHAVPERQPSESLLRPKIPLVLDLSGSCEDLHDDTANLAARSLSAPQLRATVSPLQHERALSFISAPSQLQLPPRPPVKPQQQPKQHQQMGSQPQVIQEAMQMASKLGAALSGNYQAFSHILKAITQNSRSSSSNSSPEAMHQYLASALAAVEQGSCSPHNLAALALDCSPPVAVADDSSVLSNQQQSQGGIQRQNGGTSVGLML